MGVTEVRREIRTAMLDNHLTEGEAERITAAARADYDADVAKELVDLFDKTNDGRFTPSPAGVTPTATAEAGAPIRLYGLLIATNTPVGGQFYVKQQLIHAMDFRAPIPAAAAPSTARMLPVDLGKGRTSDGERTDTGFVDVDNQQGWRRISVRRDDGATHERWEGPYDLPPLAGTHWDVRFRSSRAPAIAAPEVSRALTDRVARFWMADNRYLARDFSAPAPAGTLAERFLVGLSGGVKDSIVTVAGDESRFWVKRYAADGAVAFKGPFRADTFAVEASASSVSAPVGRASFADVARWISQQNQNSVATVAAASFERSDGAPPREARIELVWARNLSLSGHHQLQVAVDGDTHLYSVQADGSFGGGGGRWLLVKGFVDTQGTVHLLELGRTASERLGPGVAVTIPAPGSQ